MRWPPFWSDLTSPTSHSFPPAGRHPRFCAVQVSTFYYQPFTAPLRWYCAAIRWFIRCVLTELAVSGAYTHWLVSALRLRCCWTGAVWNLAVSNILRGGECSSQQSRFEQQLHCAVLHLLYDRGAAFQLRPAFGLAYPDNGDVLVCGLAVCGGIVIGLPLATTILRLSRFPAPFLNIFLQLAVKNPLWFTSLLQQQADILQILTNKNAAYLPLNWNGLPLSEYESLLLSNERILRVRLNYTPTHAALSTALITSLAITGGTALPIINLSLPLCLRYHDDFLLYSLRKSSHKVTMRQILVILR